DKDMTIIDFEGFVDGEAFEGGKGENYPLTIGSGAFIPGFEEQLIGAKIGEETEVKVTFPEDYHAESLKGKDAVFKVTVHEIKEKELPELDDEFASEVSEFDTLDEYKEDVKKKLTERKEAEAKTKKEDAVIEAIVNDSRMDIPEAMIDTQTRQMAQDYAGRLQQQGLTLEQYFQFTGMDADKFLEQMKPGAKKRIESRLVLEAVAKEENFEVTDEDYDKEVARMAESYQMEADKLKDLIGDYEKEQIIEDLKIQKAVDFVVDNAKESKK
ncbi:MAG: trigger factor, partial [Lachnospiraceae bacterium]|nr:trigger factor [Lachnospiraceae bacterium]